METRLESTTLTTLEARPPFRLTLHTLESLYVAELTRANLLKEQALTLEYERLNDLEQALVDRLNSEALVERACISQGALEIELNQEALYLAYIEGGMNKERALELSLLATNYYTYRIQRGPNGQFELPKNLVSLTDRFKNVMETRRSLLMVA